MNMKVQTLMDYVFRQIHMHFVNSIFFGVIIIMFVIIMNQI